VLGGAGVGLQSDLAAGRKAQAAAGALQEAIDVFADRDGLRELRSARVANASAHGLGCTLSAAITARLAQGETMLDACRSAKQWLRSALENAPAVAVALRDPEPYTELETGSETEPDLDPIFASPVDAGPDPAILATLARLERFLVAIDAARHP
jgi:hypothetical protein